MSAIFPEKLTNVADRGGKTLRLESDEDEIAWIGCLAGAEINQFSWEISWLHGVAAGVHCGRAGHGFELWRRRNLAVLAPVEQNQLRIFANRQPSYRQWAVLEARQKPRA